MKKHITSTQLYFDLSVLITNLFHYQISKMSGMRLSFIIKLKERKIDLKVKVVSSSFMLTW